MRIAQWHHASVGYLVGNGFGLDLGPICIETLGNRIEVYYQMPTDYALLIYLLIIWQVRL